MPAEDLTFVPTANLLTEMQRRCNTFVFIAAGFPDSSDGLTVVLKGTVFDSVALLETGKAILLKEIL